MKKTSFILFMYCAPLLFGNFGLVEYSVLHPKSKTVQADSLQLKQKQTNLYRPTESSVEAKPKEESKTYTITLSHYIITGLKGILGFIINILAHI
jgi:hypothetical protein